MAAGSEEGTCGVASAAAQTGTVGARWIARKIAPPDSPSAAAAETARLKQHYYYYSHNVVGPHSASIAARGALPGAGAVLARWTGGSTAPPAAAK